MAVDERQRRGLTERLVGIGDVGQHGAGQTDLGEDGVERGTLSRRMAARITRMRPQIGGPDAAVGDDPIFESLCVHVSESNMEAKGRGRATFSDVI